MFHNKKKQLELFKALVNNQEATNKQLGQLNRLLESGALGKLTFDDNGFTISSKINYIEDRFNNTVSTKTMEEYVSETIDKELLYNKDYERCFKTNPDLLALIESYCKYEDKYEVIELFDKINSTYNVTNKLKPNKNKNTKED